MVTEEYHFQQLATNYEPPPFVPYDRYPIHVCKLKMSDLSILENAGTPVVQIKSDLRANPPNSRWAFTCTTAASHSSCKLHN